MRRIKHQLETFKFSIYGIVIVIGKQLFKHIKATFRCPTICLNSIESFEHAELLA